MRETTFPNPNQRGFTLMETTIALFIMTIVGLGCASLFAFSIQNNSGANDRTQALALVQQQLELLRHARFSALDSEADGAWVLRAGTRTQNGVVAGGRPYQVTTAITNTTATLKLITISVTPQGEGPVWAGATVAVVTNRAKTR